MSAYSEHVEYASLPVDVRAKGDVLVASVLAQALRRNTEAILALAEQQRIANLVALWRVGQGA